MSRQEYLCEYVRRKHEEAKPAYEALLSCYPFGLENLDGEEWKPVVGFEGYEVSNFGRVKSFKWTTPRILTPDLRVDYLGVGLHVGGKKKHRQIHVLVAKAFIQNPQKKPEVNHDDGNKFNCYVSNLYWATGSENQKHAFATGLAKNAKGSDSVRSKFKDEKDIIYIRDNPDKLTQYELAAMFGVNQQTISLIQRGKCYPNEGGTIREKVDRRIPDEIRAQIRADYATGNYTYAQLAEKYGVSHMTIRRIVREGQ